MTFRSEPPATNGLRFATREETESYARDLYSRWTMPSGWEVRETAEPVSHAWMDGRAERLEGVQP